MSQEEREAVVIGVRARVPQRGVSRTGNSLVLASTSWRRDGHTRGVSRQYFESGDAATQTADIFLYARTSFYCDLPGGGFRVHRFLKSPTATEYEFGGSRNDSTNV